MLRKIVFILLAVVMVVSVWAVAVRPVAAGQQKVTVCHKPGTPAEATLEIAAPALNAHLNHGDTEGECAGPQSDGCTALNAVIPDPQTSSSFYLFSVSGLDLFPGEVIHTAITATVTDPGVNAYTGVSLFNSTGSNLAQDFQYGFDSGLYTASIDYTVVAGDDADGVSVLADVLYGSFTLNSVSISCTPAS